MEMSLTILFTEGDEATQSADRSICQSDGSSTSTDNQSTWSDDRTVAFERNNDFCSKCHKVCAPYPSIVCSGEYFLLTNKFVDKVSEGF